MNLKLEAIFIPVSDVDRAKKFYHLRSRDQAGLASSLNATLSS
jgi:hypothetical protein